MDLALTDRVVNFDQNYLVEHNSAQPLKFGAVADSHLKSILHDSGYSQAGNTSVYRKVQVDEGSGIPTIRVFDTLNVLTNSPGCSYVELKHLDESDDYMASRAKSVKKRTDVSANAGIGTFVGAVAGIVVDILGGIIADVSPTWNPDELCLFVPLAVGAVIGGFIGYSNGNDDHKEETRNITDFLGKYKSRTTIGVTAVREALSPELKHSPSS